MADKKIVTKEEIVELRALFVRLCPSLPKPQDTAFWSPGRVDRAKRTIRLYGMKRVAELFKKVEASDFLTGRNGRWGKCGLDWVLKPENLSKIMEGNYDNRSSSSRKAASYDLEEALQKATMTARKAAAMKGESDV